MNFEKFRSESFPANGRRFLPMVSLEKKGTVRLNRPLVRSLGLKPGDSVRVDWYWDRELRIMGFRLVPENAPATSCSFVSKTEQTKLASRLFLRWCGYPPNYPTRQYEVSVDPTGKSGVHVWWNVSSAMGDPEI